MTSEIMYLSLTLFIRLELMASFIHSFIHSLMASFIHSFIHSFINGILHLLILSHDSLTNASAKEWSYYIFLAIHFRSSRKLLRHISTILNLWWFNVQIVNFNIVERFTRKCCLLICPRFSDVSVHMK